ncbi:hypothetical protein IWW56_000689 [Coemansia sp. RSA 2131]|nr:hypothetical protein IWW56_000689 [Coemansia sp. RSA 2131]KAJ2544940.1 hypothetical protein GGF49_000850 [Coemansia sp. RSA 1853]KAJ2666316.1 hypothetical protein IW148_001034 [Coemansia sp. RSA 1199]
MQSFTVAMIASAALVAANQAPANEHRKAYATVNGGNYAAYAQPAAVQPVSVIQNAAVAEPTVTETVTNGAGSNALSLGAALLAGSAVFAYF